MSDELLEGFLRSPVAYAAALVLGSLLGSFANVCILRIPASESIVRPGSHCRACGAAVRWYDNLPILSYVLLRGRCRGCGARFSPRYLLVEISLALLALATWHLTVAVLWPFDAAPHRLARFSAYLLLELALVVLAFIDLDHRRIPDRITYPGIPFFVGVGLLLRDLPWWEPLLGAAVGYGIVRLISDGYWLLTKREGLGYGDGKLLAMVGGLLGWRAVVFSLFGGSVLGSVIGITVAVIARRRAAEAPQTSLRLVELPFGPFLVTAALAYLFLQETFQLAFAFLASGPS